MNQPAEALQRDVSQFVESAYLDYALYVMLDRALPQLCDGLKPVQRRIIYAMSELGLNAASKPKKSARTIGDVIGKYHPHGDGACYEAMVHMAQDFSYRYPLVDGQGNWGSSDDPKSFAAMRYTESRLSAYAHTLLQELETVPFKANFDASLQEPEYLPARLPNILLNGATGIAVGMATNILPHHAGEVIAACQALLNNPDLNEEALFHLLPAPDFPSGGIIVSQANDLKQLYRTGRGHVRVRASYHLEDGNIVIDSLPYQVSGAKIQEQIAKQMQAKKLPQLDDLRDESDHENPVRLVLILKGKHNADRLMEHLFATTELEKRFHSQMNMIGLDGKPQVKNLRQILLEWLQFRLATVRRRVQYALQQQLQRLEIVQALLQVYRHLPEIIRIIREEDEPEALLQSQFQLNERQSEAILAMRLRQLARLQQAQLLNENKQLSNSIAEGEALLADEEALKQLVAQELTEDATRHHDTRRSQIAPRAAAQAQSWEAQEALTVVISQMAWVRAAKGHQTDGRQLSYKAGDGFFCQFHAQSQQQAALIFNDGRLYNLSLNQLPSARGYGEPLSSHLQLASGAQLCCATAIETGTYLLLSKQGLGFRVQHEDLIAKNKNGKLFLSQGEALLLQKITPEIHHLLLWDAEGRLGILPCLDIPILRKGKGVQLMKSKTGLREALLLPPQANIELQREGQSFTIKPEERLTYFIQRAQVGKKLPAFWQQAEALRIVMPEVMNDAAS